MSMYGNSQVNPRSEANKVLLGLAALVLATLALEVFNVSTSYAALKHYLQNAQVFGISWAALLTIGFYIPDVGGMFALVSGMSGRKELIIGSWLVAAMVNIVLSWYALRIAAIETGGVLASVSPDVALAIAVIIGFLRFALLTAVYIAWQRSREQ